MNPYEKYLAGRDPLTVLSNTPQQIREMLAKFDDQKMKQSYEPGKWDATHIFHHLAQCEMMFGTRYRQAATLDNFVVQPFDQDAWMTREPIGDGKSAAAAFLAMREMNLALIKSFSESDRARAFSHPDLGPMTINGLMELIAGHDLNHLGQLEQIADD